MCLFDFVENYDRNFPSYVRKVLFENGLVGISDVRRGRTKERGGGMGVKKVS